MKYWMDTEFIEDGKTIDLISIGIVAEDGREFYAISTEFNLGNASRWVLGNVILKLEKDPRLWMSRASIRDLILHFMGFTSSGNVLEYSKSPEIWASYADYDWVVFCQLFGTMMDLPDGMPMFCRDIKQLSMDKGDPEWPKQEEGEHNALADARWNRTVHAFLANLERDDFHIFKTELV